MISNTCVWRVKMSTVRKVCFKLFLITQICSEGGSWWVIKHRCGTHSMAFDCLWCWTTYLNIQHCTNTLLGYRGSTGCILSNSIKEASQFIKRKFIINTLYGKCNHVQIMQCKHEMCLQYVSVFLNSPAPECFQIMHINQWWPQIFKCPEQQLNEYELHIPISESSWCM